MLARLLGADAKGRFTLVLLYSQLAALVVGFGMDTALGVVAGRDRETARRAFANALVWTAVVGGFAVVLSAWLYGLPTDVRPRGPLAAVIPNLSADQFIYAALAIPGELFFTLGLYALLGRRRIAAYSAVRLLRRLVLLGLVVAVAAIASLSLDAALVVNVVVPACDRGGDRLVRLTGRDRRRPSVAAAAARGARVRVAVDAGHARRAPSVPRSTPSSSTPSSAFGRPGSTRSRAAWPRRSGTSPTPSGRSCSAAPSIRRPMRDGSPPC